MMTNITILFFLMGMACWWGLIRGLLLAFLLLMSTIVAGAVAVSLWEPFVLSVLIRVIPTYAWGIGLLTLFAVLLISLKLAAGRLVPQPVQIGRWAEMVGGGLCGLFSAILISGFILIGVRLLPIGWDASNPPAQDVASNAQATQVDLWVPVDKMTEVFLARLSLGVFSSRTPLAQFRPALARQPSMYRAQSRPGASIAALPSSISLGEVYLSHMPVKNLNQDVVQSLVTHPNTKGMKLVLVDTLWQTDSVVTDRDGTLRVLPTQVRLVAQSRQQRQRSAQMYAPVGSVQTDPHTKDRVYKPAHATKPAIGQSPQVLISWVFMIPSKEWPSQVLLRQMRFPVVATQGEPTQLVEALGRLSTNTNQD